MARPARGLLLPVCCCLLLLQFSECSRPPPSSPAADHLDLDDALHHHHQLLLDAEAHTARQPINTEVVAEDGRTGTDADAGPSSFSSATPARAVGGAVPSSSRPWQPTSDERALVRAEMLLPLRSKLARRFLVAVAGAGVDEPATTSTTDGASASCNSNNPHINCPPAAGKP